MRSAILVSAVALALFAPTPQTILSARTPSFGLGAPDTGKTDGIEHDRDWSRTAALEEIHGLLTTKFEKSETALRRGKIENWLKRVDETDVNFEGDAFVVAVAQYFVRDAVSARKTIIEYLRVHGKIPSSNYDPHLGRVLLSAVGSAAVGGDHATLEMALPSAIALSSNRSVVYQRVGGSLRRDGSATASQSLNGLLVMLLGDTTMTHVQKQQVVESIYSRGRGTKTKPASSRGNAASAGRSSGPKGLRPFREKDLDGKTISLVDEQYKGKVVLIDFWATWCRPCLLELPHVVAAYDRFHDSGFEVIGVSLDRPGAESKIRATLKRFGMEWRQIYDGGFWRAKLAVQNGVRSIPATFLIDRSGKVRYTQLRGAALGERIAELIGEPVPAASSGAASSGATSDGAAPNAGKSGTPSTPTPRRTTTKT